MSVAELRARFARMHGPAKVERAEALAWLQVSTFVHAWAMRRREAAEAVFSAARDEAAEMPPGWREDDPLRPWAGHWLPYTWRALEALAEAAAVEGEWAERVAEQSRVCARLAGKALVNFDEESPDGDDGFRW